MSVLTVKHFGISTKEVKGGAEPKVKIYTPHGTSIEKFQRHYGNIYKKLLQSVHCTEDELRNFLILESDIFSEQISEFICELLWDEYGISSELIMSNLLRGLIDINRSLLDAIWHIFIHGKNTELMNILIELYQLSLVMIEEHLKKARVSREIHTMSPLVPKSEVEVSPNNIPERLEAWNINDGELLPTDIICKLLGTNVINVGDKSSILNQKKRLEEAGFDVGLSQRYHATPSYISPHWARIVKGPHCILDVTKDLGSEEKPGDEDFCLWTLTAKEEDMKAIALPIATALAEDYLRSNVMVN
jgi:hypothetical protein